MSSQNLNPRGPYRHPALEGLSREAKVIVNVLGAVGMCYVVYCAATDTGVVRRLNECEATFNNGQYHPAFTFLSAMLLALAAPLGPARLFDRLTGRRGLPR